MILIESWDASDQDHDVYWDFGKGERPQKTMAEFALVAKKESIPVVITRHKSSLKLHFPEPSSKEASIRVRSPKGVLKAEVSPVEGVWFPEIPEPYHFSNLK